MNILNIATDIVKLVKKQNLNVEVVVHESKKTSVSQRLLKLEEISQSKDCVIGIRVIADEKKAAYISTNDLSAMNDTVNLVIEMAKNAPEDPYINFAEEDTSLINLNILDDSVITIDDLKQVVQIAENSALAEKNITNSEGASSSYNLVNFALATASGFISSFSKSTFTNQVSVVAGEGSEMKVGYDYDVTCQFADLKSPELIGREAARRAAAQLNSRTIETSRFPVVFEKRAAKELVKSFASGINGRSIASNNSFLKTRKNTKVFSDEIEIIDDPLIPKGIASRPFDGEGMMSEKNILVKNGMLQNWILDLYSAKQLNLKTTKSAMRGKNASIFPAASNFYIKNGSREFQDIIQEIKKGIYVTELFGFGVNLINGDYSQGAFGFFIEDGKISYPVHEITVASNLNDMFANLVVANDLSFCGQFNSPTIKINEMTVAGV